MRLRGVPTIGAYFDEFVTLVAAIGSNFGRETTITGVGGRGKPEEPTILRNPSSGVDGLPDWSSHWTCGAP
jgi:hypothetical protein